jgi:hypothetical protein
LLYRFVFGFIIPVYKTTRQVKRQFGEMNQRMQDYMKQQEEEALREQQKQKPPSSPAPPEKDYLEFEEVK